MNLFKKLIASRTIQGIAVAALGGAVEYAKALLTPELLAQYGSYITAAAALLQTTGLGRAIYGRLKAQGPIT
jgi:hypothetical protein